MCELGGLAERQDPPDLDTARHWYEQAAAGNTYATYKLGRLDAEPLDPPDLRRFFEIAAAAAQRVDNPRSDPTSR